MNNKNKEREKDVNYQKGNVRGGSYPNDRDSEIDPSKKINEKGKENYGRNDKRVHDGLGTTNPVKSGKKDFSQNADEMNRAYSGQVSNNQVNNDENKEPGEEDQKLKKERK